MNNDASPPLPDIDCVVIGVNTEATLARCLSSIMKGGYPANRLHIIYVDGGSIDTSIKIAEEMTAVKVISLEDAHPTPGRGRNAGWRVGSSPLVQFMDSDTIVESDWFEKAVAAMADREVGAVQGYRKEMHPEKSIFNWLTSLEWNGSAGEADSFGGDVLIRREILEQTKGYDDVMVGGEDPELSQRVRSNGWKILQLDTVMTHHDIAMTTVSQYWKRTFRSGYGFAAVIDKASGQESGFWFTEFRRILIRGGGSIIFTILSLILFLCSILVNPLYLVLSVLSLGAGLFLLFFPRLFRVNNFKEEMGLTLEEARIYAWHCSVVVIPDIFGVIRYYYGKISNNPLRNNPRKLKTQKSSI